ncbi:hypothetical protein EJ02DRAFT_222507 [Clathrospora elynae]|uniref:Uncharacterized protein n=1 Tax=Clathrospora elynae TaxID=706981 RepID=A0A6A5S5K5_9PLEO|nr:hypothetical protein EJ02DRAFT_131564 [Clathrospora elynae]KAF1940832.1 hypothetical protein EJ02DRAFT_222507 [Clathrospora elynae]
MVVFQAMKRDKGDYILSAPFRMQEEEIFQVSLSPLHLTDDEASKRVHNEIYVAISSCLCVLRPHYEPKTTCVTDYLSCIQAEAVRPIEGCSTSRTESN